LKNRLLEPFVVTAKLQNDDVEIPLTTHIGNEFDYVLKGTLKVSLDGKIVILNQGDSITYDSSHPHGMIAIGNEDCEFLAIVTKHDQAESTAPIP